MLRSRCVLAHSTALAVFMRRTWKLSRPPFIEVCLYFFSLGGRTAETPYKPPTAESTADVGSRIRCQRRFLLAMHIGVTCGAKRNQVPLRIITRSASEGLMVYL